TATRDVDLIGGGFCGLPESSTVTASAVASTAGSATTVNQDQLFPLALSADAIPTERSLAQSPLSAHHLGDMIVLPINSQSARSASFTTFKYSSDDLDYLKAAVDQALKPDAQAGGLIPRLTVGDAIHLYNGNRGGRFLAMGDHQS